MSDRSPVGVIIPAYNEAGVIGRLLDALAPGVEDGSLEVVVVPNGCTDDTADVARRAGVTVVELDEGSKIAALNTGDAAITAFPRFYVDGDVVVTAEGLQALAAACEGEVLAASPAISPDMSSSSRLARSYLRVWYGLSWATDSLGGRGCYGVSEQGRARWDQFPDQADDQFVDTLFEPGERRIVDTVHSVVQAPRTLRSAVQIKRRLHLLNKRLESDGREVTSSTEWISVVTANPRLLIDAPVYVAATITARFLADRDRRRGTTVWHRDESTRPAS